MEQKQTNPELYFIYGQVTERLSIERKTPLTKDYILDRVRNTLKHIESSGEPLSSMINKLNLTSEGSPNYTLSELVNLALKHGMENEEIVEDLDGQTGQSKYTITMQGLKTADESFNYASAVARAKNSQN